MSAFVMEACAVPVGGSGLAGGEGVSLGSSALSVAQPSARPGSAARRALVGEVVRTTGAAIRR